MQTLIIVALAFSAALNIYQAATIAVVSRDHSWGIGAQGSWHWRLIFAALAARIWPVAVVHLDVDRLKQLNATLGEARANELLRMALRRSDLYRTQSGDECMALIWRRRYTARQVAERIMARLADLPLTEAERAALGGPVSATIVTSGPTRRLRATLRHLVRHREQMKARGRRGQIEEV